LRNLRLSPANEEAFVTNPHAHFDHPFTTIFARIGAANNSPLSFLSGQQFVLSLRSIRICFSALHGLPHIQLEIPAALYKKMIFPILARSQEQQNCPEITIVPIEPALVSRDEPLEMMEKHPAERGAFRMTRTIDSRYIGNERSRNRPGIGKGKNPGKAPRNRKKSASESG
jgi:hypothetical protein